MVKIKRALISVSDKTGILELGKALNKFGVEILSTGGTAKILRENNIPVKEVSEHTGFPEMLDGRVKTLHPKIHGGLLTLRNNPEHMKTVKEHGIGLIDMVVVNLYPFEKTTQKPGVVIEEAIENIDIGGPSMLRSAAKNHQSVAVVCNPARYAQVIEELNKNKGSLPESLLRDLGVEVYQRTSLYDAAIYEYLSKHLSQGYPSISSGQAKSEDEKFPKEVSFSFEKIQELRYGENSHQKAAFYKEKGRNQGIINFKQLQGKELSYNNILDLNAAFELVKEFSDPAAVVVKHNNPCGVAEDKSLDKAYLEAWKCDRLSAFGGIVALNRRMDIKTARLVAKSGFLECIIAPGFDKEALELFKEKKNLRLLESYNLEPIAELDFKRVSGGLLLQDKDLLTLDEKALKVVTKKKPTKKEMESLIFAWKVAKHVKSNAIILVRGRKTVGVGAGQMSRVDSVFISTKKAGKLGIGSVMASDAFFPKEDAIQLAAKYKIKAIIQPGGSIADEAIIKMADKHKIAMVMTGIRHFRH
ncbi:MAG: bifunctional phosphoribosylaminoimidazolecarboxamide formyltransferase/IMP cyclohydrolase [Candidatus Omnitrophica bacterium]|nr:bifunctional phosphoribosylaminoimidazolecarboxamide formyltransferase/IMP cyclohydrolase [Candidatus Omnitrophota bacterium]